GADRRISRESLDPRLHCPPGQRPSRTPAQRQQPQLAFQPILAHSLIAAPRPSHRTFDRARAFMTRARIVDGDVNKTRRYVRPLTSAVTLRAENQRKVNGSGAESAALRPRRERAVCDAEALCTVGHA